MLLLAGLSCGTHTANGGSDCISDLSDAVLVLGHPLELQLPANVPREVLKHQLLKLPRGPC